MLKILIGDHYGIVRKGLIHIILESFPSVQIEEADNPDQLIDKSLTDSWHVIISGFFPAGKKSLQVLQEIVRQRPDLRILKLGFYTEEEYSVPVLEAGACGYMSKSAGPEELVNAIREILAGNKFMKAGVQETIASKALHHKAIRLHELLSEREHDVFILLANGKSISQIGLALSIGNSTVSTYRSRIMAKMRKKSNAELTRYALENQII
jgi:two-component system, NarL family, invasion response regulator UvrY